MVPPFATGEEGQEEAQMWKWPDVEEEDAKEPGKEWRDGGGKMVKRVEAEDKKMMEEEESA